MSKENHELNKQRSNQILDGRPELGITINEMAQIRKDYEREMGDLEKERISLTNKLNEAKKKGDVVRVVGSLIDFSSREIRLHEAYLLDISKFKLKVEDDVELKELIELNNSQFILDEEETAKKDLILAQENLERLNKLNLAAKNE